MRVEYKNPEILKRPDSRIVLKDVQGIWEPDTKTLRLYYEGNLASIPTSIISTDGDDILELILEGTDTTLGNSGNIIYIEFPEDTKADISLSGTPSNITYLESRGYAVGENILRGINTLVQSKLKKFISKTSWYRYFRINRLTKTSNLKRLDWAGRTISRDYYERQYSGLQLFCDGVDEDDNIVYDFKMATACLTFYGFAIEETYRVEGTKRTLVAKEIVSLENVPGLNILELDGGTQNFVLSIDSEHLRAELLTISDFNPDESDTVYHASFIAEVYDSGGQRNTSYPLEITTQSARLAWYLDLDSTSTMFREEDAPVFLFRYNDGPKGTYHTMKVSTLKPIDNTQEVSIVVGPENLIEDPYFIYEMSFSDNALGGTDIMVKISPNPEYQNLTDSWVPKQYADTPEPRKITYRSRELVFYAIIGPKTDDLYVIEPGDESEEDIEAFEFSNDILGGDYIVKSSGEDTYWNGFATHSKVFATVWGYTGYVKPEDNTNTDTDNNTDSGDSGTTEEPKVEVYNFDIPGLYTNGAQTDGLWIFPSSCCVRPGQVFTIETAEVKGGNKIWCKPDHLGSTSIGNSQSGGRNGSNSSSSFVSRGGTGGGSSSGTVTRQSSGGTTTQSAPVLTDTLDVNGCFKATRWIAPDSPGNYEISVRGQKDQSKVGYCMVKVTGTADTSDPMYLIGSARMICFRKDNQYSPSADMTERGYYNLKNYTLKIYTYYKSNPNNRTLVTNLEDPNCDIAYRVTKPGIIEGISKSSQGLKIFIGETYGVTQLIIYLKSDPSIFIDIPVVLFGGKYTNYQLAN